MGKVDVYDNLLSTYRPRFGEKERYYSPIAHVLNTSVIAAWRIPSKLHQLSMFHLNFRREITLYLMKSARAARPQIRGPQASADVRHVGVGHFPECTTQRTC